MYEHARLWLTGLLLGCIGCTTVPTNKHPIAQKPRGTIKSAVSDGQNGAKPPALPILNDEADSPSVITVSAQDSSAENAKPDVSAIERPESESTSTGYTLNLDSVLALADAQNPNVALARERINEAYARVDRAEALWYPSLRAGLNYNHHEGQIQDVAGNVFNTNRSSFYGGFGANAVGAGSPAVPGLVAQFHLSDAVFQPKIAEHQAASRQFGATAVRNDTLRDTAVAYLELVRAEHALAITTEAMEHTRQLFDVTRQFAETGQGLQSDFQRVQAELAGRQEQVLSRQEAVLLASARLAQVLHADPTTPIHSGEPVVTPLDVLAIEGAAANYVATGLQRRPELAEQKHLVCEAVERLRREKYAPLVPSVLLGMSYGALGGGLGSSIVNSGDRWDADAVAYWEIRNLGYGEKAAREETASLMRQAQHREVALLDRVAREVTDAYTQVAQRRARMEPARASVTAAEKSYALNLQRIENLQGLPIEALQSITALATAQQSYLNAVVDYNAAQFQLCHAIGWFVQMGTNGP